LADKKEQEKVFPKVIKWQNMIDNVDKYIGFVYKIIEKDTGMIYFGIKRYWEIVKLPPLKGRSKKEKKQRAKNKGKNKRHIKKETKWKTYNTSSPIMQEKLKNNPHNYEKIIIKHCTSITEMKAHEAYYQLQHYVNGTWNKLYNEVINLRLRIRK